MTLSFLLTIARRWLSWALVLGLGLGVSSAVALAAPTWLEVAHSSEGVQYVDPESIEVTDAGVRLNSYWQPAPSKGLSEPVYYVTEYDCQGQYRDVEATGQPSDLGWDAIGSDDLNRGAMMYGCAQRDGRP